jgi:hypothetical protein
MLRNLGAFPYAKNQREDGNPFSRDAPTSNREVFQTFQEQKKV